ncbi:MAG: hypothetical protein E7678_02920 [Ruminococcaceae bacterium]|nr:hypothetical protein [Oscillospiraceae bacterium]
MYRYGSFSYSIDKIKLKGRLRCDKNISFPHESKISIWCNYRLPKWCELINESECLTAFRYRYCFSLRVKDEKEGTFTIFESYNGDFREQRQVPEAFLIEYNPNKSGQKIYDLFCKNFVFSITDIVSFDIAYDIPGATAQDVLINTKCDVMTYGKVNNRTLYIAPKENESGRVKVYTKSIERATVGIDMTDTLRIEASIKCKGLDFNTVSVYGKTLEHLSRTVEHLNSVKINKNAENLTDWKSFALSRLTAEDFQKCLSMMSINIRSKYRKEIISTTYYTLDLDVMTFLTHITTALAPWKERIKIK